MWSLVIKIHRWPIVYSYNIKIGKINPEVINLSLIDFKSYFPQHESSGFAVHLTQFHIEQFKCVHVYVYVCMYITYHTYDRH